MLKFYRYDAEYGRGALVAINPAYVESVVESERRCYGSLYETALITMCSGAGFTVIDSGRQAAMQIAEAQQKAQVQP